MFLLAGALAFACLQPPAQEGPTEYEVKAAFLFNFAKFIDWPEKKLAAADPLIIGVLGDDPFGDALEKTIGGKKILGHDIHTRRYGSANSAREAHIVFISPSEKRRLASTLETLDGHSVLTVSEIEEFCENGGMVNFRIVANKVRFEINQRVAEGESLKISSKLLSVAIVKK